jgi:hypothetical protein
MKIDMSREAITIRLEQVAKLRPDMFGACKIQQKC